MNVLVTGGAGYIGSIVAERLLESDNKVIVYDNLSKGHRNAVPPGAELVAGEIDDAELLKHTLQRNEIEAVIHMAAHSLVGESMQNPSKYFRNNISTGIKLIDCMLDCEVKKMVFSSTAAVYGEPDITPINEETPQWPTNPYGESKLAFERILAWYEVAQDLRYASLRYFNAAGASERLGEDHSPETHLIPIVLSVALGKRLEVEVYGDDYPTPDGTCIRDYIHVVDLADAHILALQCVEKGSRIFNLGNGCGYSVREVVETARQITGHPIPLKNTARRGGDPAVLVASSERIKKQLGWNPRYYELETIIETAWAWHKSHPDGYEE